MNKNAKKWIKALESGEYGQCRGRLTDGEGFCCLGVATDLFIRSKDNLTKAGRHRWYWAEVPLYGGLAATVGKDMFDGAPPLEVRKWLGFKEDKDWGILIHLNDGKKNFKQIAKYLKDYPELFDDSE